MFLETQRFGGISELSSKHFPSSWCANICLALDFVWKAALEVCQYCFSNLVVSAAAPFHVHRRRPLRRLVPQQPCRSLRRGYVRHVGACNVEVSSALLGRYSL